MNDSSEYVEKQPCPACREQGRDRTGDNLAVYPGDRGAHCFACGYHVHGESQRVTKPKLAKKLTDPLGGRYKELRVRKIDEKTCRMYGYRLAKFNCSEKSKYAKWSGTTVHVADYWRDGELCAQHVRFQKPKSFKWEGDADIDRLSLFGQHLWCGRGKRIVITEGEIDCMTVSMLWRNRWPVVSLASGVKSSVRNIKANLEFLSGYDEIILFFDNDEQGRIWAEKCAEILPPGKVKIVTLPEGMKDANDMHRKGQEQAMLQAIYEARSYQPDGILHISDIRRDRGKQQMWTWPWDCLTRSLMGMRSGEMTLIASGTGSGKSTWVRELAYHHILRGRKVGLMMLEENPTETEDDLISLHLNKPVRQILAGRELNLIMQAEGKEELDFGYPDDLTEAEYDAAAKFLRDTGIYIYDHGGRQEYGNCLARVEYLASGLDCDLIFVDHVTAVASDIADQGGERQCIDHIMKTFRSIVERTGVHIVVISQLNRLDGRAAEEGGQISLKNLRGSGSLGFWPNNILAIERDQQAEDPDERRIVKVRGLKGRFTGETGVAGTLKFNSETRRLEEIEWSPPVEGDSDGRTLEDDEELGQADADADAASDPDLEELDRAINGPNAG